MISAAVVCIGEMFRNLLPTGHRSPLHLAAELHRLGRPVQLLSHVGDDKPDRKAAAPRPAPASAHCCPRSHW